MMAILILALLSPVASFAPIATSPGLGGNPPGEEIAGAIFEGIFKATGWGLKQAVNMAESAAAEREPKRLARKIKRAQMRRYIFNTVFWYVILPWVVGMLFLSRITALDLKAAAKVAFLSVMMINFFGIPLSIILSVEGVISSGWGWYIAPAVLSIPITYFVARKELHLRISRYLSTPSRQGDGDESDSASGESTS